MIRAAATKNAAEETSPGTSMSKPGRRPAGCTTSVPPCASRLTPSARSILSVWSREPVFPPIREGPVARRAARRRLLFTWALGTGRSHESGCSSPVPGMKHSGANLPASLPSMRAPIRRRGSTTLPMGLREQRLVTGEHGKELLPRQEPRQQPRRRARVLGVEGPRGFGKPPQPDTRHLRARPGCRRTSRRGIPGSGAWRRSLPWTARRGSVTVPSAIAGQHQRPVRDGLVGRRGVRLPPRRGAR